MSETAAQEPQTIVPAQHLNVRQNRFVDHYLASGNASEAGREAGYSSKTAEVQGRRLLQNATVRAEIARRRAEVAAKVGITAEYVLSELIRRAALAEAAGQHAAAIKATELVGKTLAMFIEKSEVTDLTPQETEGLAALGESLTPEQARIVNTMHQGRAERH